MKAFVKKSLCSSSVIAWIELITWSTPSFALGSLLSSSSTSSTLVALACWGLFLEVLEEEDVELLEKMGP